MGHCGRDLLHRFNEAPIHESGKCEDDPKVYTEAAELQ